MTFHLLDIDHQLQNENLTLHGGPGLKATAYFIPSLSEFHLSFTLLVPAPLWRFHVCRPSLSACGILNQKVIL